MTEPKIEAKNLLHKFILVELEYTVGVSEYFVDEISSGGKYIHVYPSMRKAVSPFLSQSEFEKWLSIADFVSFEILE